MNHRVNKKLSHCIKDCFTRVVQALSGSCEVVFLNASFSTQSDNPPPTIAIYDPVDFIMPRAPFGKVNDCNGIPFQEEIKC